MSAVRRDEVPQARPRDRRRAFPCRGLGEAGQIVEITSGKRWSSSREGWTSPSESCAQQISYAGRDPGRIGEFDPDHREKAPRAIPLAVVEKDRRMREDDLGPVSLPSCDRLDPYVNEGHVVWGQSCRRVRAVHSFKEPANLVRADLGPWGVASAQVQSS